MENEPTRHRLRDLPWVPLGIGLGGLGASHFAGFMGGSLTGLGLHAIATMNPGTRNWFLTHPREAGVLLGAGILGAGAVASAGGLAGSLALDEYMARKKEEKEKAAMIPKVAHVVEVYEKAAEEGEQPKKRGFKGLARTALPAAALGTAGAGVGAAGLGAGAGLAGGLAGRSIGRAAGGALPGISEKVRAGWKEGVPELRSFLEPLKEKITIHGGNIERAVTEAAAQKGLGKASGRVLKTLRHLPDYTRGLGRAGGALGVIGGLGTGAALGAAGLGAAGLGAGAAGGLGYHLYKKRKEQMKTSSAMPEKVASVVAAYSVALGE
jgi:hypothetical protein